MRLSFTLSRFPFFYYYCYVFFLFKMRNKIMYHLRKEKWNVMRHALQAIAQSMCVILEIQSEIK